MEHFDLIVIGGGPAGEKASAKAAYFGKKVAIVEMHSEPGGAGVHTGTLPSKTLKETALFLSGKNDKGLFGVDKDLRRNVSIEDFLLEDPGNNIVFRYAGKQYGIPLQSIFKKLQNDEALFYECTREFTMAENYGTFEFNQIYAKPYVEIALASRFYLPFENFQQIASIPTHVLWELTPTNKIIKNAASRASVLAGGPVMSQLHCQAGSDLSVFTMKPFTIMSNSEPEAEEEEEEETFVNVKMGEDITKIDITDSKTFDAVRSKYAALKQKSPTSIQFIFGAGPVQDYSKNVIPGVTILARQVSGARRRTYRKRISKHKKNGY
jgi:hypothetical protein